MVEKAARDPLANAGKSDPNTLLITDAYIVDIATLHKMRGWCERFDIATR